MTTQRAVKCVYFSHSEMKLSLQVAGISGESSLSKKASNGSHQFTEYFEGNSTDALDIILFYGFYLCQNLREWFCLKRK